MTLWPELVAEALATKETPGPVCADCHRWACVIWEPAIWLCLPCAYQRLKEAHDNEPVATSLVAED